MNSADSALYHNTPLVTVTDNRGLAVRMLRYHRHPDSAAVTDERITRNDYNARAQIIGSIDPRLYSRQQTDGTLNPNFRWLPALHGDSLRTDSADAGTRIALRDIAGRPHLDISATGTTRRWLYEANTLPGRPLTVTEQPAGQTARISERFVWAADSAADKAFNLAGQPVRHYDSAGLSRTDSIALTGTPSAVSRQLLAETREADWQGDESAWQDLLETERFTSRSSADASGSVLSSTDAMGNSQRRAYDIAGQLKGCWLTLQGAAEQVIVKNLSWSAAGQKLRE
ncbi:RHS repeat protein, partial [Pantoea sp. B65]